MGGSTESWLYQQPNPEEGPSKKRKLYERTVVRVKIEAEDQDKKHVGPPCDSWSWRKYGQKPVKGSPYTRSYYKCSTAKGCTARKQVERCNEDASTLIITYNSPHNHPTPTQKDNLTQSNKSVKRKSQDQVHTDKPHCEPATPEQGSDSKDDDENSPTEQSQESHSKHVESPNQSSNETQKIDKKEDEEPYVVTLDNLGSHDSLSDLFVQEEHPFVAFSQLKKLTQSRIIEENCDFFDDLDALNFPKSSSLSSFIRGNNDDFAGRILLHPEDLAQP